MANKKKGITSVQFPNPLLKYKEDFNGKHRCSLCQMELPKKTALSINLFTKHISECSPEVRVASEKVSPYRPPDERKLKMKFQSAINKPEIPAEIIIDRKALKEAILDDFKKSNCRKDLSKNNLTLPTPQELSVICDQIAREKYKWEKYRLKVESTMPELDKVREEYEKYPEKHPLYVTEWTTFWSRRCKELKKEGKDISKHDFIPEWKTFWYRRLDELHVENVEKKKAEFRKGLSLPADGIDRSNEMRQQFVSKYKHNPQTDKTNQRSRSKSTRSPLGSRCRSKWSIRCRVRRRHQYDFDYKYETDCYARSRSRLSSRSRSHDSSNLLRSCRSRNFRSRIHRSSCLLRNRLSSNRRSHSHRSHSHRSHSRRSHSRRSRSFSSHSRRSRSFSSHSRRSRSFSSHSSRSQSRRSHSRRSHSRRSHSRRSRSFSSHSRRSHSGRSHSRRSQSHHSRSRRSRSRHLSNHILSSPSRSRSRKCRSQLRLMRCAESTRTNLVSTLRSSVSSQSRSRSRSRSRSKRSSSCDALSSSHSLSRSPNLSEHRFDSRSGDDGFFRSYRHDDSRESDDKMDRDHNREPSLYSNKSPMSEQSYVEDAREESEPLTVLSVLQLLAALEEFLGSLGPKVMELLFQALALNKIKPNSADTMLINEENCLVFEVISEVLKGHLISGCLDQNKVDAVHRAVNNIAAIIRLTNKTWNVEETTKTATEDIISPIDSTSVSADLNSLVFFTDEELKEVEDIVDRYYSQDNTHEEPFLQRADQPPKLTVIEMQTLLKNFMTLSKDHQRAYVTYVKELKDLAPAQFEEMRNFVDALQHNNNTTKHVDNRHQNHESDSSTSEDESSDSSCVKETSDDDSS